LSLEFKKLVRALRDIVESMGVVVVCGHSRVLEMELESAILEPGRTGFGAFGEDIRILFLSC
jgi:hypothetical protein